MFFYVPVLRVCLLEVILVWWFPFIALFIRSSVYPFYWSVFFKLALDTVLIQDPGEGSVL